MHKASTKLIKELKFATGNNLCAPNVQKEAKSNSLGKKT